MSVPLGVARTEIHDLGFDFSKREGHWSITDFTADGSVMTSFEVPYASGDGYAFLIYVLSSAVGAGFGLAGRSLASFEIVTRFVMRAVSAAPGASSMSHDRSSDDPW